MDDETTGRLPDDDDELTRVTPPDDATRVMPPAGEGETQVMPGADTGATRVMPAQGAGGPPPPTQPTLLMTHGRGSDDRGGVPWWVWLIVVLAIVAAAAALWYFYLRPRTPRPRPGESSSATGRRRPARAAAWSSNSPATSSSSQYDPQLQQAGSTNADLVDDALQVSVKASALGLTGVTGSVNGTLSRRQCEQFPDAAVLLRQPPARTHRLRARRRPPAGECEPHAVPERVPVADAVFVAVADHDGQPQPIGLPDGGPAGPGRRRQAAGRHRGLGG